MSLVSRHTIHANIAGAFDCTCEVVVSADGETIGLEFPQITKEEAGVCPLVYVAMRGTTLTLVIGRSDLGPSVSYAWDECLGRWAKNKEAE